jgi:hypothetical protein
MTQRVVNYTYGTGNPVLPDGSIDVRDGVDNLQSFDIFMNADEDTYNQRDGDIVKTRAGAVRAVGIQRIGDFTTGCTVTERNQGVLYETGGTVYVWLGSLPKAVPPASSPATTGGLGTAGWLDIGDASVRSSIENGEFNEKLGSRHPSVNSAISDVRLKVGDRVIVDNYHTNGNSGVLFFNVVAAGTGVADGGKYINTTNGLQLMQNLRLPMSPSAWGAKADGTNDSVAINKMISRFKSTLPTPPANKNYDAKGKGLDFSGRTYNLAAAADFSGIDNLSVYNPSFVGLPGFVGTELVKFSSLDPTWYVENVTLWNPYFDCNWNVDFGFDAADFLNLKVMGGKLTHYRMKGFRTRRINVGPHEVNMTGTFIFQREYNETFPVDITEGEAFEIGNYDNNFTNVVIGYQKKWAGTLAKGANMFSNCHFYSGVASWPESGVRSLDTADDFDGCYFDSVPLFLRNRSSVSDCYFVIEATKDFAIELTELDPYMVKITSNRFRKNGGTSTAAIKMKTIAEGRITRPDIYDNKADGCTVLQTKGAHPVNISNTSTNFALPDQYQPLSSLGPVYLAASADGLYQERIFCQAYDSTTKHITVNCYTILSGNIVSSNLGGKQALINFNQ